MNPSFFKSYILVLNYILKHNFTYIHHFFTFLLNRHTKNPSVFLLNGFILTHFSPIFPNPFSNLLLIPFISYYFCSLKNFYTTSSFYCRYIEHVEYTKRRGLNFEQCLKIYNWNFWRFNIRSNYSYEKFFIFF
jgi:hypothetical protein